MSKNNAQPLFLMISTRVTCKNERLTLANFPGIKEAFCARS